MLTNITDLYKNNFIKAVLSSNKELYTYIHTNLNSNDLSYSNTIGYGGDNSLNIDLYAEKLFIKDLKAFGNIYSEECGFIDTYSDFDIIIDPIDGSDNFMSGLPYYGTSIALKYKDEIIAGFVYNLATDIMIYKAFNSEVISLKLLDFSSLDSDIKRVSKIGIFERAYAYPKICQKLYENKIKYRSPGAVALSLSNAKNYDFVLFCGDIREFDIAAALYISSDLFIYKTHKNLLISKNKLKFELIKEFIKEE